MNGFNRRYSTNAEEPDERGRPSPMHVNGYKGFGFPRPVLDLTQQLVLFHGPRFVCMHEHHHVPAHPPTVSCTAI
jgi:hypothetical protein